MFGRKCHANNTGDRFAAVVHRGATQALYERDEVAYVVLGCDVRI